MPDFEWTTLAVFTDRYKRTTGKEQLSFSAVLHPKRRFKSRVRIDL
ncbi:MAG: hypothetical protein O2856_11340 [Planctomycetota bacterium]|nr:hypothetical protein [Planctomycetota bacterium]